VEQQANCREFTTTATIDGRDQQLVGQVCQQADGSWQIVQEGGPAAADLPALATHIPIPIRILTIGPVGGVRRSSGRSSSWIGSAVLTAFITMVFTTSITVRLATAAFLMAAPDFTVGLMAAGP
jgi:hypothetical protein